MTFPFGWRSLLGAALFVVDVVASLHVVLRKRDSRSAAGWVGIIWLVPGIGVLMYLVFGLNRIRRRGMELQRARRRTAIDAQPDGPEWLEGKFRPRQAGMARIAERLSGRRLLGGNSIEPLHNGDEAYPAMLDAIERATRSVALCSYIFNDDRVGRRFIDALARARQRGVAVCVLVDDVGLRYSFPPAHWAMKRAGITVARFLPILSKSLLAFFNLRSHRKLLVVDGTVAFAGGMNIQAAHVLGDAPKKPVRDIHFRIRGPVVRQLQDAFAEDWQFVTGQILEGEAWRADTTQEGNTSARVLTAGPDLDFEIVRHVLLGAIASARDSLRIMTPYFLPDTAMIAGLRVAALRGVRVDIVLPERGNIPMAQWASRALLWQLLKAGCRVHLSPPPFDHSKLFVVDRTWTLFGTTNWDARSLRLNFELDVECYDEGFAARTDDFIARRIAESREFTLADADGRPFPARVRDGLARLLMPYL
ncbi:MAG TPA: phospholipase D-like domain-containing protein [Gemmatimonadaceae bacterium]|nr:phospholipase D-like domain-containing protein [Gemmatimonadaceae bacterium]